MNGVSNDHRPASQTSTADCKISKGHPPMGQEKAAPGSIEKDIVNSHGDREVLLIRRLDWRFLLPKPNLGSVAYVGATRGTLLPALQRFCASLTVIQDSPGTDRSLRDGVLFDLVVVRLRGLSDLRAAVALLKVGGYLYWEIDRPSCLRLLGTKASIGNFRDSFKEILLDCARVAKKLNLSEIQVYWHRPDFEECREIIPLNHRPAVEFALSQAGGVARFFTSAPVRHFMRGELLRRFLPCVSIVACKTDG